MMAPNTEAALRFIFPDLSSYEYRILAFLLEYGDEVGAFKIQLKTDVPRTKVYSTMVKLVNKNLATMEIVDQWRDITFPENWEDYGQSGKLKFKNRNNVPSYQYLKMGRANVNAIKERIAELRSRLDVAENFVNLALMKLTQKEIKE